MRGDVNMSENPCRYCVERDINCRSICSKYISWKTEDEKRRKRRENECILIAYEKRRQKNMRTRRKIKVNK